MTPVVVIISAFLLALIVASLTFMGGAVPVAIPAAVLLIAAIAIGDYSRRRKVASESSVRYEHAKAHAEDRDTQPVGDPSTVYTGGPQKESRASMKPR
jgi:hypothetical protein